MKRLSSFSFLFPFSFLLTFMLLLTSFNSSKAVTYLYFQNNTSLSFGISATQFGPHIMDPGEWSGLNGTIGAWQPDTEILWTNRDQGINNGVDFFFDCKLANGLDTVVLQLKLNGNFVGSDMWQSARGPGFNHVWFDDRNFHTETFNLGGKSFTLKYTAYFTGGDDDVRFALQENQPYTVAPTDTNGISIFAYNIYCLSPPIAFTDQTERATEIPNHVHDYDVLIISEAFDNDARNNYLTPGLFAEYPYNTGVVDDPGAAEDGGVIIYSRWPIEFAQDSVFQDCDGSDCLAAKGVMYARINKNGKKYHVFGTHTQAWATPAGSLARLSQFRTIRTFIDQFSIPAGQPVLVGGDLNVDRYQNYLSEFDSTLSILNADSVTYIGHPYTWDADHNYYADGAPPEYLDYVFNIADFASPDTAINEPRILRSISDDMWDLFDLSDHFGVYGRFVYPTLITDREEVPSAGLPDKILLLKAWPNPFDETSHILFENTKAGEVEISIYDSQGRKIRTLISGKLASGRYKIEWDGFAGEGNLPVPAGIYLIRAVSDQQQAIFRLVKQ